MAIIVLLMALIVPAFTQISAARQLTAAAYDITGVLENARAYAKANDTYTWVGFFEEGFSSAAGTAGIGRVVISAVASKDATAMYIYNATTYYVDAQGGSNLVQLGKLLKINNLHLSVLGTSDVPARGKVPDASGTPVNVPVAYQVGDLNPPSPNGFAPSSPPSNQATFGYPLNTSSPAYKFVKVIQFNPLGDATKIVDSPTRLMEIGLRFSRNGAADTTTKDCVAVQLSGIGGQARIYQP